MNKHLLLILLGSVGLVLVFGAVMVVMGEKT